MADIFTKFDKQFISGDWEAKRTENRKREEAAKKAAAEQSALTAQRKAAGQKFFDEERQRNQQRGNIDETFLGSTRATTEKYTGDVSRNERQYQGALDVAKRANDDNLRRVDQAYKTLSPLHREAMDSAATNARQAMSLQDYMDPNNQVARGTRELYNAQGQKVAQRYETQAQNEQRQGLANYGVMSSLGAQAAANAMAGQGPMTVGQQMAQMATAGQQASEAYANTQRRLQQLRDSGMSKQEALEELGLEQGFARSDKAYAAGQDAKESLARRMQDFEGFSARDVERRAVLSDRNVNIAEKLLGSKGRMADTERNAKQLLTDLRRGVSMSKLARETGLNAEELNYLKETIDMELAQSEGRLAERVSDIQSRLADIRAADEGRRGIFSGMFQGGSGILGSVLSGGGGGRGGFNARNPGQSSEQFRTQAPNPNEAPVAEAPQVSQGEPVPSEPVPMEPYSEQGVPQGGAYGPMPEGYGLTAFDYSGANPRTQPRRQVAQQQRFPSQTQPFVRRPSVGQYG